MDMGSTSAQRRIPFAGASARTRLILGYSMMVATAVLWAGAWLTAKVAAFDAPPLTVAAARFVVAAAALLPLWLWFGRAVPPASDLRAWGALLLMGLFGGAIYNVFFLIAEQKAPAADGGILTPGMCAVSATLIAWAATRQRPATKALVGLGLSLVGAVLVGWIAVTEADGGDQRVLGDLLLVGAGVAFGVYTVFNRGIAHRVPAITAVLAVNVFAALMMAPAAIVRDGVPDFTTWSDAALLNVAYLGLFSTALAFTTFFLAVKLLGIARMAPTLGLVPVLTAVGAAVFLRETLSWAHVLGAALVLVGVALPAWRASKPQPTNAAPGAAASLGAGGRT